MAKRVRLTLEDLELQRRVKAALDRVSESKRKRAEKRERQLVTVGSGASFLLDPSLPPPPGGAHTDLGGAGGPDTPTPSPLFLPSQPDVTTDQETRVVWSPQAGPQHHMIQCPVTDVVIGGSRGGGKLQPLTSQILTPKGWTTFGAIRVGDMVIDPTTGGSCAVIGVYPQGVVDIYRVTCDDGASCLVGLDHLWAYKRPNHIRPRTKFSPQREFAEQELGATAHSDERWDHLRVGPTEDLAKLLAGEETPRIPLTEPVIFTVNDRMGSGYIGPYLMGLLLGDGHIPSLTITACDDGIRDFLDKEAFRPASALHTDGKPKSWRAYGATRVHLRQWVLNSGLEGCRAWQKFVPQSILTSSLENRLAFLQGLMDTDGTVDERGRCYFTSTSLALAEGVRQIARSLGGKASIRERVTQYTYLGEKKDGRPSWTVRIWLRKTSALFRLSRKKARCTDSWNGGHELMREVVSVEKVGREEAMCIRVDTPHGLYVTDDYIVTHNSQALIGDAAIRAGRYGSAFRGLFLRRQQTELLDVKAAMREIYVPLGAHWNEQQQTWTFPGGGVLILKYLMNDDDAMMYKGWNVSSLYIDEVGDFPNRKTIDLLWGAMRSAKGIPITRRMSCNPGGPGHCLTFGQVLTPAGFVDIKDMKVGDPVYTVASDGRLVEATVSQFHSSWHDGEVMEVNARGLTMACTPNHKVAKVGGNGKNPDGSNINRKKHAAPAFSLVPFEKLPGQATVLRSVRWTGVRRESFSLPDGLSHGRPKLQQPDTVEMGDYASFMGWFLSEGYTIQRTGLFGICQMKPENRLEIERLCSRIGFRGRWRAASFDVSSRKWTEYLSRFGKCRDKYIPAEIKEAPPDVLERFVRAAMAGDGHWESRDGGTYYTISRRLADDFSEVALKAGYIVYTSERTRPNRDGLHYAVSIKKTASGGTELLTGNHIYDVGTNTKRRSDVKRVPYSGPVYCIGIEGTHSFVVRQNGSVWVSGNSWVKQLYLSHGPYRVFRYAPNEERKDLTMDAVFIPAKLEDNPLLLKNNPQYEVNLAAACGGDQILYRAWRYGDWDGLAGTYFNFSEAAHVAIPPPMAPYLKRWIGMDWGYAHPSAVVWFVEFGDRAYAYRERLYSNTDPVTLGRLIAEVNMDEPISDFYLSPDAFARRTSEQTIAMGLEEGFRQANEMRGCALLPEPTPADNDRVNGWQAMAAGFASGRLLVSPECSELVRVIQGLVRDPKRPNDVQKVDGDDVADAARYGWATRRFQSRDPLEVRAAKMVSSRDPNERAMQERLFWAAERRSAFGWGPGVSIRGGRVRARTFE